MKRGIKITLWSIGALITAAIVFFAVMVHQIEAFYFPDGRGAVSTVDRISASNTLRCSYMIWDPYLIKDLSTGKLSGIAVDYINAVAARNGMSVDWVGEVGIDQLAANLDAGKSDMFCMPCSSVPSYDAVLDFGGSFGKLPYYTYVRAGNAMTPDELAKARFVVVDGYIPSVETPKAYPQARIASLPLMTTMGELYDQLKYGKADALVNEHVSALNYMRHNPDVIKRAGDVPVVVKDMSFPYKNNDTRMGQFVNDTFGMQHAENKKLLEELSAKYGLTDGALLAE